MIPGLAVIIAGIRAQYGGGFGNIIFAKHLSILFQRSKVIFYFDTTDRPRSLIDLIERNFENYQICDDLDNLLDYGNASRFREADFILNSSPFKNEVRDILNKKQLTGANFYRLSGTKTNAKDILTGFCPKTQGIFISAPPVRNLIDSFDGYDVYTCYLHDFNYIKEFIKFISQQPTGAPKGRLLVVQGDQHKDRFATSEIVDRIGADPRDVYLYNGARVMCEIFTPEQSAELFYYSNKITAVGGDQSLALCISFNKLVFTEPNTKFYEFVKDCGFGQLLPLFKGLQKPPSITDKLISSNYKFCEMMRQRFNLDDNLTHLLTRGRPNSKMGGDEPRGPFDFWKLFRPREPFQGVSWPGFQDVSPPGNESISSRESSYIITSLILSVMIILVLLVLNFAHTIRELGRAIWAKLRFEHFTKLKFIP